MKIAMIAPIAWRTPPRAYGPWELVTSLLTEALVARGVDVTLFATQDSITAATLAGPVPALFRRPIDRCQGLGDAPSGRRFRERASST